jgi:hypothetical protein
MPVTFAEDAFLSLELGSVTAVTRPLIPDFPGNNELKQRVHPEISDLPAIGDIDGS